jgi:Uma2 family endonuclease
MQALRKKPMSMPKKSPLITVEEYLEGEKHSDVKHEYVAGRVYAMVGASEPHNLITGNLYLLLRTHLQGTGCRVFFADMKVRTQDAFYYPDIAVSCEPGDTGLYYKTAPRLIVEVLSPGTQRYDAQEKRLAYQGLDSLQEYVMVAQEQPQVQIYRRRLGGWDLEFYAAEDRLRLASVDLDVPVSAVYEDVWR